MPTHKNKLGVGDLILNSPFEEPAWYWSYDRKYRVFTKMEGRRSAGYVVATDEHQAKRQFVAEWVQAINAQGGFGRWASDVSYDTADIEGIIARHAAGGGEVVPIRA